MNELSMNEKINELLMNEWMNEWLCKGKMNEWTNWLIHKWIKESEWMVKRMDEWMNDDRSDSLDEFEWLDE